MVSIKHYASNPRPDPRRVRVRVSSPGVYCDVDLLRRSVMGSSLAVTSGRKQYIFIEFTPNVSNHESLVYLEHWGMSKSPI